MVLSNKNAVIYGAGGSLGGAVAKAFAAAGAHVFLTGYRAASVQRTADAILAAGGKAEVALVDAFDEAAVTRHLETVIATAGTVDISFNAVDTPLIQGIPLTEMSVDEVIRPVEQMLRTRFLTAKATARWMIRQRSGVLLTLTATPSGIGYPYTGGFAPACSAIEKLFSNLAAEIGQYGIRVVNIRSGGSPDSRVFREVLESNPVLMKDVLDQMRQDTMLKELPLMADIANTAVFLVSDLAAKITGVTVDVTAGTTAGLNYRTHP